MIKPLHVANLGNEHCGCGKFEPTQTRQCLDGREKPPSGSLHLDEVIEAGDPLERLGNAEQALFKHTLMDGHRQPELAQIAHVRVAPVGFD